MSQIKITPTKEMMQQQLQHTHQRILHLEELLMANPDLPEAEREDINDRLDDLNDLFIIISNKLS
jgi:hypothetical protein